MNGDIKSLKERGDKLFAQKAPLDSRNQDIALNFYPERADFTGPHSLGEDFAGHLSTSYPLIVRRDLGNTVGSMLRPKAKEWFFPGVRDMELDHASERWLEWTRGIQRRAMYDPMSGLSRTAKQTDNDFVTFGQSVFSVELDLAENRLLYRSWHLRDVVWTEDAAGNVDQRHIRWKPTVSQVNEMFPEIHPSMAKKLKDSPDAKVEIRRIMVRSEEYGKHRSRHPWTSLYIDVENEHLLEERGSWTPVFAVPRWATISGSQYAYSPATLVALPDARLVQAQTLTLLEAGEKAVNPPLIGVSEAMRSDLQIYAGGFTAVDKAYDERLGSVLRPLNQDTKALPFGVDVTDRTNAMLREAFFLNALTLPETGPEMTAYEVGQRVQEYIRQALPLFEPMEDEYNARLCDYTFDTLLHHGAFGSVHDMPEHLQGRDIDFTFESPLSEMIEREKGQKFLEAKAYIAQAAEADPNSMAIMDFGETLRDVLDGIGVPKKWLRSEEEMQALTDAAEQREQAAMAVGAVQAGAEAAKAIGEANQALAQ